MESLMPAKARAPRGRPAVGKDGVKISEEYQPFSCLLEPGLHAMLGAIATVQGVAQREVVEAAIRVYAKALPASDRELVKGLLARRGWTVGQTR